MSDFSQTSQPSDASKDISSDTVLSNAGGNALLDAQVALTEEPQPAVLEDDEAATNFSGSTAIEEPSDGKTMTTTGAYPVNQSQFDQAEYPSPTLRAEDPDA